MLRWSRSLWLVWLTLPVAVPVTAQEASPAPDAAAAPDAAEPAPAETSEPALPSGPGPAAEPAPVAPRDTAETAEKSGKKKKKKKDKAARAPALIPGVVPGLDPEADPQSLAGDSFGDRGPGLRVGFLQFRFLMQARYAHTFAPDSQNPSATYRVAEDALVREGDGLSLHRFFVRIAADPLPYVQLKTIVDLAELVHDNADNAVKQAYVTLKPVPKHIELTVGLFKLPFSVLELDPIADYRFAELGIADDLVKDLGLAGRDIGAELTVAPLSKPKWLRIAFGAFRAHAHDESRALVGAFGGRIESQPIKGLRVGIDWIEHPKRVVYQNSLDTSNKDLVPNPADLQYPRAETWDRGRAASADIRYRRHHLQLAVEGMLGNRVDVDTRYGANSFIAIWGIAGYNFHIGNIQLLPALRAGWMDADRQHPVGVRRELSFALNIDFTDNLRLLIDVTRTDVQANTPLLDQPKPLPETPYMQLDDTRLVTQLQVVL